jgi:hypothetical protein
MEGRSDEEGVYSFYAKRREAEKRHDCFSEELLASSSEKQWETSIELKVKEWWD